MKQFFAYARERYSILLKRRARQPAPWTTDPILGRYRFCNVFRTDDTVTQWIRQELLNPLTKDGARPWNLLPTMTVARFINRIDTLEAIKHVLLLEGWHRKLCKKILYQRRAKGLTMITGAYMIRTPFGMNKIEGLDEIFTPLQKDARRTGFVPAPTLQEEHARLTKYNYVGSFMAYEIVTDLSYAVDYDDTMLWAAAGPGAARGLSRVMDGKLGRYRNTPSQQAEMNALMREILAASLLEEHWPSEWPRWDMRTCEHTLCEFDKYERARLGEGEPKQRYLYD